MENTQVHTYIHKKGIQVHTYTHKGIQVHMHTHKKGIQVHMYTRKKGIHSIYVHPLIDTLYYKVLYITRYSIS